MELKKKIIIGFVIVFVLITGIIYCFSTAPVTEDPIVFSAENLSSTEETNHSFTPLPSLKLEDESENKPEDISTAEYVEIFIYVCGEVKKPGVYALQQGNRIVDAIAAAGGFCNNAAKDYLNQAMLLTDGEKIYVPSKQEAKQNLEPNLSERLESGNIQDKKTDQGKVNLNTASKDQLMTLPGIGESKAEKILSYRETKGKFGTIEEIMNIDGIKTGVFDKIKDLILAE